MTTFNLSITLDPAAVHSGDDVQRALALTGAEIANRFDGLTLPDHLTGTIRDAGGAQVGTWSTAPTQTAEQIADAIMGDSDSPKPDHREWLIAAVRIARGEV